MLSRSVAADIAQMMLRNVPDDAARRYLVFYSLEIHAVGQELSRNIDEWLRCEGPGR